MICNEYQQLTPKERTEYIGQLIHSCMSDGKLFEGGKKLIKQAESKGLFEGVTINPPTEINETEI